MIVQARMLSTELRKKAETEINEDSKRIPGALSSIREWLKFQNHLNVRNEDQFLLNVLRGCKFSTEQAKKKIDYYYTVKSLTPEFFKDRSPFNPFIQTILKSNCVSYYAPKETSPIMCYCMWSKIEENNITLNEIIQHYFMAADLLMNEEDVLAINGIIIVFDLKNVSLKYLLQVQIPIIKKYFSIIQKAYPIRIKGIYAINAPSYLYTIYKMIEVVFSEKIKNRIKIYSTESSHKLFDIVPQSHFPNDIGGSAGFITKLSGDWRRKLESYESWFREDEKYKCTENLRLANGETYSEIFGLEGSFNTLSID